MFVSLARKSAPFPLIKAHGDQIDVEIKYYRYCPSTHPLYIRLFYIAFCVLCGFTVAMHFINNYGNMFFIFIYAAAALVFWAGYLVAFWVTRFFDTLIYSRLSSLKVTFTKETVQIRGGAGLIQSVFGRTVPVTGVATFQAVNATDVDNTIDPRNLFVPEMAVIMVSVTGAPVLLCINSMSMAQNAAIVSPLNDTLAHIKRSLRG